jgi:hypothetical protein
MKPYERSELGGVGEGLRPVDRADPLTQLQLGNKLPSLRNPFPLGEGIFQILWCAPMLDLIRSSVVLRIAFLFQA